MFRDKKKIKIKGNHRIGGEFTLDGFVIVEKLYIRFNLEWMYFNFKEVLLLKPNFPVSVDGLPQYIFKILKYEKGWRSTIQYNIQYNTVYYFLPNVFFRTNLQDKRR